MERTPTPTEELEMLKQRLDKLNDDWALQCHGIERTHGPESPAAKAIEMCIGDLNNTINYNVF